MGASFWHCGHLQALQEGALRSATPFVDTGLQVGVRRDERPVKGRVFVVKHVHQRFIPQGRRILGAAWVRGIEFQQSPLLLNSRASSMMPLLLAVNSRIGPAPFSYRPS